MLRRLTPLIIQSRTIKHTVDIKWVRPEYIPAYKAERSGDLEALPPIPETALGQAYALSEEIKDAPEAVKKIFSVGHLGKKEYNILVKSHFISKVRRHQYDESTAETRIARLTGHIRCLQDTMENDPKNVIAKKTVQELIDKRKKLLKFLRQYDYKKFEWLLEKLNIEYKAHPDTYNKLSRKESLRKLTEMHCDNIKNKKLDDYRTLLESQQGPFLTEKLEALKFIRSEQIDLQLPITVTEQDIKKVEEQLKEWTIKDEIKQQAKKKKRNILLETE
ncbi:PREDICTED: 28S ribosomal protein S15, mitochondrial [Papilio xuthus]|uniref:Small ribosomal subunit protein uS15m n=1 Tax=Papilio xuthus TaxID=66420 RepID=A0A194PZY6_PAPXU|nr:PREDICTED: 28S ribosomal protein S15, mitochondrial [Papilio xuthus]KPI98881.1 28S ribosomal protein S15, mitochondrial [Papilio xuthus]